MTTEDRLRRIQRRIEKATAPRTVKRGLASRGPVLGDGLPCPDGHGPMYRLRGTSRQWCPHQRHDLTGGAWKAGVES